MDQQELARRIAELPIEKRALLFEQLQRQRQKQDEAPLRPAIPRASRAPRLFRALLFRLGEAEHLFFLNVHHIVYDGWSRGVFLSELTALYEALAADPEGLRPPPLPELPVQYLDFALWQRNWLSGEVLERQLAYWRGRLPGAPPLDPVTGRPRP